MTPNWMIDTEFKEHVLEDVRPNGHGKGYTLMVDGGLYLGIPDPGFTPVVGERARFYGQGFGSTVRGVVIAGRVVYYRTKAQEHAKHLEDNARAHREKVDAFERERDVREARYLALPEVFRQRIDRFRAGSPDFQVEHEPYEVFCCEQAVKIADGLGLHGQPDIVISARLNAWKERPWAEQQAQVSGLSDGHSGNTLGIAMRLAYWYATFPSNVVKEHGALTPLTGCADYGCTHEGSASRPSPERP